MNNFKQLFDELPSIENIDEVSQVEFNAELGQLISQHNNLAHLENKYKDVLEGINRQRQIVEELKNRLFPPLYMGVAKQQTSKEPYIVARTPWRKGVNDFIHLRVYVGAISNFKGGKDDPEAKKIALYKMRKKIQSILPPVE
jgi:hypothetical protein